MQAHLIKNIKINVTYFKNFNTYRNFKTVYSKDHKNRKVFAYQIKALDSLNIFVLHYFISIVLKSTIHTILTLMNFKTYPPSSPLALVTCA